MVGVATQTCSKRGDTMSDIRRKRVRISSQRQFTIPKEFFDDLGLGDEAFIEFNTRSKQLTIKPTTDATVDFSADILRDLQKEGYTGEELIQKFLEVKSKVPDALEKMKQEALSRKPMTTQSLDDYLDSLEDEEDDDL